MTTSAPEGSSDLRVSAAAIVNVVVVSLHANCFNSGV